MTVLTFAFSFVLTLIAVALSALYRRVSKLPALQKGTVAFFHPFADGGGGGERVLWCAIQAVQTASPASQVVIYVRSGPSAEQLVHDAAERFNIVIAQPIQVVPLPSSGLVLPERYPRFTLIMQALGSVRLGYQALQALVPEVFIDTTGWAFTYPLARWAGSRVVAYVHYPTVSTDMLARVWGSKATYNNDAAIAGSTLKSALKVCYYQLFALLYGACGGSAHVTMANSSWTLNHVRSLWWWQRRGGAGAGASGPSSLPVRVYPPCDTEELRRLPLAGRSLAPYIVSVAQFRPEKNHRLQLLAYAMARRQVPGASEASTAADAAAARPSTAPDGVRISRLKMVGSCRNADDAKRLAGLQAYAEELGVAPHVDWLVNVPFSQLRSLLGGALGGLHTMVDEHFGISVVEYMAAGAIPIAHNSAGPRADIVVSHRGDDGAEQRTGFLAITSEEFADAITQVLVMDPLKRMDMAAAAQQHAHAKFSTQCFLDDFTATVACVMPR